MASNKPKKWRPSPLRKLAPKAPKKKAKTVYETNKLLYMTVFSGNENMRYRIEQMLELGVDVDYGGSNSEHVERVFEALEEGRPIEYIKDELEQLIDPVANALGQVFYLRDARSS